MKRASHTGMDRRTRIGLSPRAGQQRDRHLIEWSLFMLVSILCLAGAWSFHVDRMDEFFPKAYDGLGYFQWLPTAFITGDFDMMPYCHRIAETKALSLFTLGVAVLELPFFLIAQWLTWLFGYDNTGFSSPNAVALMVSAAVYTGAGAVLSFKLARRFSSTPAALLAVLGIFGCSNLYFFATNSPLMSHVYSYFLITLFAWCSVRVIDGPRPTHVFGLLFSGALLVLVRQMNGIVIVFPLLLAWSSPGGIPEAWRNLMKHRAAWIGGLVLGLVPWVLQMIYWHHITGHLIVDGYAYKDEHFEWDRMVPGKVLFSPISGWFVYSPVFLVVVATLLVHAWRNTRTARAILIILSVTVLIYSAWWCWWLGGGYGYRGLIDLYGLLALPFAWFFRSVLRRSLALRVFVCLALIAMVHLNLDLLDRYDYAWSLPDWNFPKLFEVVGKIAAGQ
jgi:hypothetical protein